MATAGTFQISTSDTLIYDSEGGCTSFRVAVLAASAAGILVNIPGLHTANEWFPIAIGDKELFRLNNQGIRQVHLMGDGGLSDVNIGVVSKTR